MAVIKYDVEDVESGGGGTQPEAGKMYAGKIVSITPRKAKADGAPVSDLEIVVDIGQEFVRLWTYVKLPDDPNFGPSAWKFRELTDALGLPPKGSLDPKKNEGKPVNVKIAADVDQGGDYKGKIKNLYLPGSEDTPPANAGAEEEPWTEEDLAALTPDELKAEMAAMDVSITGRFSAAKAIEAILEAQDAEPEPEDTVGDHSAGGVTLDLSEELLAELKDDADFYADWSDDEVKDFAEQLGITGNITGRKNRAKYVEAITALAASQGDAPEGEAVVPDDYDTWPENELQDEINTRNEQGGEIAVSGRKTKAKLIAALREDDKASDPF